MHDIKVSKFLHFFKDRKFKDHREAVSSPMNLSKEMNEVYSFNRSYMDALIAAEQLLEGTKGVNKKINLKVRRNISGADSLSFSTL